MSDNIGIEKNEDDILVKEIIKDEEVKPENSESDENVTSLEDLENNDNLENSEGEQQKELATYYIKINYTANVVTIYSKDENNNYTIPYKAMVCSCGTSTPTSGVYTVSTKYRWLKLYGGVYGQYASRIVNSILFHSVPYLKMNDNGSLEYWEYDKLGQTASAGCVRLTVEDAKWIYDNCEAGTKVEFYSDSNVGPLGKPIAQKISENTEYRNWDPTDDDKNNPWKKENTNVTDKNNNENTDNQNIQQISDEEIEAKVEITPTATETQEQDNMETKVTTTIEPTPTSSQTTVVVQEQTQTSSQKATISIEPNKTSMEIDSNNKKATVTTEPLQTNEIKQTIHPTNTVEPTPTTILTPKTGDKINSSSPSIKIEETAKTTETTLNSSASNQI